MKYNKAPIAFKIIEYYYKNKDNTAQTIANQYAIHLSFVHKVLANYFKNDQCLVIGSKMNPTLEDYKLNTNTN